MSDNTSLDASQDSKFKFDWNPSTNAPLEYLSILPISVCFVAFCIVLVYGISTYE